MSLSKVASFLFEGTRSMFYLRGPRELAFAADEPPPAYATIHGLPMFFVLIGLEAVVAKLFFPPPKTHTDSDREERSMWVTLPRAHICSN